jgi:hypothetical protein
MPTNTPSIEELLALFGASQNVPPPPPVCEGGGYPTWVNNHWVCGSVSIKSKRPINQGFGESGESDATINSPHCGCEQQAGNEQAMDPTTNPATPTDPFIPGTGPTTYPGAGNCLVYRGFGGGAPVSMSTSPCSAAGCDPSIPKGLWAIPGTITVAAVGGTFELKLTTPRDANLWGLIIQRVSGSTIALQSMSPFITQATNLTYPAWGSTATAPDPNLASIPALTYSSSAILDGQNPLPPWVMRYNMNQTNAVLKTTFTNADPVVANIATIDLLFIVNFGR